MSDPIEARKGPSFLRQTGVGLVVGIIAALAVSALVVVALRVVGAMQ